MTSRYDSDSDDNACPSAILARYRLGDFPSALQQSYNYKRATEELADIWRCVSKRDPQVRKALLKVLLDDTMMAVRTCDGYEFLLVLPASELARQME